MEVHDNEQLWARLLDEDLFDEQGRFVRALADERISRGQLLKRGAAAGVGLTLLSTPTTAFARARSAAVDPPLRGKAVPFSTIVAEAKKEGQLNVIALPHDWANYGEIIATFKRKYKFLKMQEDNPNGSSAQENQAIRSLKNDSRAPDVVDVGPSFAIAGAAEGLYAKYFVTPWKSIPRDRKDGRGFWWGDYWGVISFGVNQNVTKNVPKTFQDLLKPEYKNQVALNGSPLASGSAVAGVFAASIANGGSLNDVGPGIDFFARLKKAGNFIPVQSTPQTINTGQTPISIDWDYLNLGYGKQFPSAKIATSIPKGGIYGAYFAQAISAFAPHPWAARLWEEFLMSDQGQLLWLKGLSHPARFEDLVKRKVVPKAMVNALPPANIYAGVKFANAKQLSDARAKIQAEWTAKVG